MDEEERCACGCQIPLRQWNWYLLRDGAKVVSHVCQATYERRKYEILPDALREVHSATEKPEPNALDGRGVLFHWMQGKVR